MLVSTKDCGHVETASCFLNAQMTQTPSLIALTALSSSEAKFNAVQIGFDAFLAKTANPHLLTDPVLKLVSERRLGAGLVG